MSAPPKMTAVEHGTHQGIDWCIVAAPIPAGNGYVRVPDGHPWAGLDYDDIDVSVSGGLTFARDGWIGFDTLHAGDYWPEDELARLGKTWRSDYRPGSPADECHWSVESLIAETKRLAEQVAAATSWTTLDNLELAVQHIDSAVAALVSAALDAPHPDVTDEAKVIAVYLRHQASSVYALWSAVRELGGDPEAELERALGAEPGWAGA